MQKILLQDINELENLLKEMSITDKHSPNISAWIPGGVSKFFGSIQKTCSIKDISNLEAGKIYVLLNGTGSIYDERGNSVGYFQGFGNSFLKVEELGTKPKATVFGSQFKVTSDGGIGNTPSEWAEWDSTASGEPVLENMTLGEIETVLEELKIWNKQYEENTI